MDLALMKVRFSWATASDGTRLFVRDHGAGPAVVLLSAWTFHSETWGQHQIALAEAGCRVVAPDRRGHGRSDDPGRGYDMDTLADDVAAVLDSLDLRDVTLVGHSMGAGEAVRYLARHGSARVSRLLLLAPITPCLSSLEDNPNGIPVAVLDEMREAIAADFPKWLSDNEPPFFTPGTSREARDWIRSIMQSVALPTVLACHRAFTAADFRGDCRRIDCPTLVLHGDRDASAPLAITGRATAELIPNCRLTVIEGAPHALPQTHWHEVLDAMLACARH
jgi:pimeloyl-ACP methyl ester carboxylesterase